MLLVAPPLTNWMAHFDSPQVLRLTATHTHNEYSSDKPSVIRHTGGFHVHWCWVELEWFGLVSLFNGISNFVGYLMPSYPCKSTKVVLFNLEMGGIRGFMLLIPPSYKSLTMMSQSSTLTTALWGFPSLVMAAGGYITLSADQIFVLKIG